MRDTTTKAAGQNKQTNEPTKLQRVGKLPRGCLHRDAANLIGALQPPTAVKLGRKPGDDQSFLSALSPEAVFFGGATGLKRKSSLVFPQRFDFNVSYHAHLFRKSPPAKSVAFDIYSIGHI